MAAVSAKNAPTVYCPVAPMLNRPVLKAKPTRKAGHHQRGAAVIKHLAELIQGGERAVSGAASKPYRAVRQRLITSSNTDQRTIPCQDGDDGGKAALTTLWLMLRLVFTSAMLPPILPLGARHIQAQLLYGDLLGSNSPTISPSYITRIRSRNVHHLIQLQGDQ